jgi:DNA-binding transcriptional regulator/RsmH inhibitor MraZ
MPANNAAKLFLGNFSGKLDDKNRLTIPKDWREQFEGDEKYVAMFYYPLGTIMVFPPTYTQKISDASDRVLLSNPEGFNALSQLGKASDYITCDKAGRVILRDDLLKLANISKELRFSGSFKTFQISSPTPPPPDTTSADAQNFLRALREIGL